MRPISSPNGVSSPRARLESDTGARAARSKVAAAERCRARAHVLTAVELADALFVDPGRGLTPAEVVRRRAAHGWNELRCEPPDPFWKLVLAQFDDSLVKILLVAAFVSFVLALTDDMDSLRALAEPAVILTILVLNALVGAVQETNAAKAIEALKAYEPDSAIVLRCTDNSTSPNNNSNASNPATPSIHKNSTNGELGEVISYTLRAEQSMLTGESKSVAKDATTLDAADEDVEIHAKRPMLFAGTTIAYGSALALVTATGECTEMGKIGAQVLEVKSAPSPLKQRLDKFGELLSRLIGAICAGVWLMNIGHFSDPAFGSWMRGAIYYFKIAISLAVAAIPEGLPAVVTTCLALGTRRMARRNAIARSLHAVETLGTCSVICSDKTVTFA
ncbi:hypothetical protein T492DRAFT_587295 [Pavlovales sp. CCMP2436]|nr:hypothetical protein T492DRAFT_587295 [Pavlovales sp. CCMP2436]